MKEVYLSLADAKKYVGKGFNGTILTSSKNEFGKKLGYSLRDLDTFIADRKNAKENKLIASKANLEKSYVFFKCSREELSEIENFKKIHGLGYRELVLRIVRNSNKSPLLLALFK